MKRKLKRYILFLAAAVMYMCFCACAFAEPDGTIEYVGGLIEKGNSKGLPQFFSLDDELTVAYVSPENGELTAGELSVWNVIAEGGTEPYTYAYALYTKGFADSSNIYTLLEGSVQKTKEAAFVFTIPDEGWYILQFTITDANGDYVKFQSARFASSSPKVRQTVAGIVEQHVAADMSEYEKALILHDYLCEMAEYDTISNIHEPAGVLLQGKGVCESFALAYQLLLGKAGIENYYVEGYCGLTAHAWNLVKLDGDWYHVDVTWDENRTDRYYFGMSDALIERSHTITSRVPAANGTQYNAALNESDGTFASVNELYMLLQKQPSDQKAFRFYYTGKGSIASQLLEWQQKHADVVFMKEFHSERNNWHTMYVYGTIQQIKKGKTVEAEAFAGLPIQKIYLAKEYYEIGRRAFADCSELREVHIPISVGSIAADAFEGCDQITIYAPAGSEAAAYAAANGIEWVEEPLE